MRVSQEEAQKAIAAAITKAEQTRTRMCIAVVNSGANLKAFFRMHDACATARASELGKR